MVFRPTQGFAQTHNSKIPSHVMAVKATGRVCERERSWLNLFWVHLSWALAKSHGMPRKCLAISMSDLPQKCPGTSWVSFLPTREQRGICWVETGTLWYGSSVWLRHTQKHTWVLPWHIANHWQKNDYSRCRPPTSPLWEMSDLHSKSWAEFELQLFPVKLSLILRKIMVNW